MKFYNLADTCLHLLHAMYVLKASIIEETEG